MEIHPLFLLSLVAFFGVMCLAILVFGVYVFFFNRRFFNSLTILRTKPREIDEAFHVFAKANNLIFDKGSSFTYPNASGLYRSRLVTISLARPLAPPPHSHTVVFTQVRTAPNVHLEIAQRGRYYHQVGMTEFASENKSFDEEFQLRGNSPGWIKLFLTQAAQNAILESGMSLLRLNKGRLAVYMRGFETRQQTLESLLNLACTLAELMDKEIVGN